MQQIPHAESERSELLAHELLIDNVERISALKRQEVVLEMSRFFGFERGASLRTKQSIFGETGCL